MFDGSSRQSCRVRTAITNTPLHALTTLNDVTWVEAARVLAERTMHECAGDPDARLRDVFTRVLARPPVEREMATLRRMLERQRAHYCGHVDDAAKLLAEGAAPRDAKLDPAEHAAMTSVALALFNLDEALTRE